MQRYAGISPFTGEQKNIFFGRSHDIAELYEQIVLQRQVLLYAKSGVGKTSLLKAGVIPQLQSANNLKPLEIRFKAYSKTEHVRPVQRIAEAVLGIMQNEHSPIEQTIQTKTDKTLWYYFKRLQLEQPETKIILIFDQFEELFSYPPEDVEDFKNQFSELLSNQTPARFVDLFAQARSTNRKVFNRQLMGMLNSPTDIKAVYTIRSDRLSDLNRLRSRIPDIQKSFYELKPLNRQQAEEAIVSPATMAGDFKSPPFRYSRQSLNKILDYLTKNGKQNVETTQLQIICQRIEEEVKTENFEVLPQNIPSFKNVFTDFYHDSIQLISSANQDKARKLIENELIRNEQRISLDGNICKEYLSETDLQKLVTAHLLRAERNSVGGFSYELSHDTLIEPISEIAKKRQAEEKQQELAEKKRIEDEKRRKNQRRLLLVVSVAAVVSIAFGIFGFIKMREAQSNLAEAIKFQIIGKQKDASSFKEQREYKSAIGKYKELDTLYLRYNYDNESVLKKIEECKKLYEKDSVFEQNTAILDSLFKNSELILDYQTNKIVYEIDSLIKSNTNLDYNHKEVKSKIANQQKTFERFVERKIGTYNSLHQATKNINPDAAKSFLQKVAELEKLLEGL